MSENAVLIENIISNFIAVSIRKIALKWHSARENKVWWLYDI